MNNKDFLYKRLELLGDMIGDGDHENQKQLEKEYLEVMIELGIAPSKKKLRNKMIDQKMRQREKEQPCLSCGGELKQIRSGSMKADCVDCNVRYVLLTRNKK